MGNNTSADTSMNASTNASADTSMNASVNTTADTIVNVSNIFSNKLVYINNEKLEFLFENNTRSYDDKKCFIISMIGCARIGKSTYINAFLTYLLKQNVTIAKTSTSYEHCTTGVDYICFPYNDINIIILDSQGLNYDDSKYDDKILTFLYSISNVVIYHCNNIIDNQTLSTLTSLCIVSNYIGDKKDIKPKLFFRIRDYSLEANPEDFLNNTFELKRDQYDGVRKAIKNLFPKIGVFVTETLDKRTLSLINKNGLYQGILDNNDHNFVSTFETILIELESCECVTMSTHFNKIPIILNNINTGNNLSCIDYDYYTLLTNAKFTEFWDSIDPYVNTPIVTSKYQEEIDKYNRIVDIVTTHYNNCIEQFTSMDKELLINKCDEKRNMLLSQKRDQIELNHVKATEYIKKSLPNINANIIEYVNKTKLIIDRKTDISQTYDQIQKMVDHFINVTFDKIDNDAVESIKNYYSEFISASTEQMKQKVEKMNDDYEEVKNELNLKLLEYEDKLDDDFIFSNLKDSKNKIKKISILMDEILLLIHVDAKDIFEKHKLHCKQYIICESKNDDLFNHKSVNNTDIVCNTFSNVFINCRYSDISTEFLPILTERFENITKRFNDGYKKAIDDYAILNDGEGICFELEDILLYDKGKCLTEFAILQITNDNIFIERIRSVIFGEDCYCCETLYLSSTICNYDRNRDLYFRLLSDTEGFDFDKNEFAIVDKRIPTNVPKQKGIAECTDDEYYIFTTNEVILKKLVKMCDLVNYNHRFIDDFFKCVNLNFKGVICKSYKISHKIPEHIIFANKLISTTLDNTYLNK